METQTKTTIAFLQELLAAHAARIEGYEQLAAQHESEKDRFTKAIENSRQQTAQLMEELSAYGDASHSEVNRDTPVHKLWTAITTAPENATQDTLMSTVAEAEKALAELYAQAINEASDLPDTLRDLLEKQLADLSK